MGGLEWGGGDAQGEKWRTTEGRGWAEEPRGGRKVGDRRGEPLFEEEVGEPRAGG